jgi:hypothetical protein
MSLTPPLTLGYATLTPTGQNGAAERQVHRSASGSEGDSEQPGGREAMMAVEPTRVRTAEDGVASGERAEAEESPVKVQRRRRSARSRDRVSLLAHHRLWLAPFMAEAVLLLAAALLSVSLYRVIWTPGAGFPYAVFAGLAALYFAFSSYARFHELFLPRAVVFLGVGSLALGSLSVAGFFVTDAYLLGGKRRLLMAMLVIVPQLAFLARCVIIFGAARFTPALSALTLRADVKSEYMRTLRAKLRFWLS